MTLAFSFLKIHDIPFLRYVLLVIEFSRKAQKRYWYSLGSGVKGLTTPPSEQIQKKETKTEVVAKKTIMSLSDVSKMLDRNTFDHLKTDIDSKIDQASDKYLIHESFLDKNEDEIEEHADRLSQIAKERQSLPTEELLKEEKESNVVKMQQLKEGNVEIQVSNKNQI